MRYKRLKLNTISSILTQIVTVICGFILPRFMLSTYGSTVNGLVSSITQFLSIIAFMQLGVGAVVQSSFYKPLADNNFEEISKIYVSAQKFFRTIAIIFSIYTILLAIIYPLLAGKDFDFWYSSSLIIIIAISTFAQYYYGLTNQLLLWADQKVYISLAIDSITIVLNTLISIILMRIGASIQVVKLVATSIFVTKPVILMLYVNKHYAIDRKIKYSEEPIKQKWNGFAQHLASAVMDNTDVIILTIFSSLDNVSIYYVYHLVVNGIRQLLTSMTVGAQSYFGKIVAVDNGDTVRRHFRIAEVVFHFVVTILFTCVFLLIIPFVKIFTSGVNDISYTNRAFAYLITLAQAVYCYRLVYFLMIKAAGHYKETQASAIIEMALNLCISIVLVIRLGLVGVAIGTLIATGYRAAYFIRYLSNKIINIQTKKSLILFVVDMISACLSLFICSHILIQTNTYFEWAFLGAIYFVIVFSVSTFVYICYLKLVDDPCYSMIHNKLRK